MAFYQIDASALVKRYVTETGSVWLRSITVPDPTRIISIAEITRAEVASALARRAREGSLTPAESSGLIATFLSDCVTQYQLVPVDNIIVDLAVELVQRRPLRAYDAVQLAAVLVAGQSLAARHLPPIIFVSSDDNLIAAAQAEGLTTDNPNWHP